MKMLALRGNRGEGKFAIVDDDDFDKLNAYKWVVNNRGYVQRNTNVNGKTKGILMHRVLLNASSGILVDHINRNKLDNRKGNLRLANKSQNSVNCPLRVTNRSGYKGVSWNKDTQSWKASITKDLKAYHIGLFKDKKEAARAYDFLADKFFGEFAELNFPGEPLVEYKPKVLSSCNTSGYRGVSWRKDRRKWCARIKTGGKYVYRKHFDCKHAAARQYNEWALEVHGSKAKLNDIEGEAK